MFREDYLMRQFRNAGLVLAHILGLRKSAQYDQAQLAVDEALETLLGLRADLLHRLEDEKILDALTIQGHLDEERLLLVAELYHQQGEIWSSQGQPDLAIQSFRRALNFYLEAAFHVTADEQQSLVEPIDGLSQKLGIEALPEDLVYSLFTYYEAAGFYSKADDTLMVLRQLPYQGFDMQVECLEFYRRLLRKPETALQQGGLSRQDVLEKYTTAGGK